MRFQCVSRTDVGLKRKINEDSILVWTERGLWAVADGMGGHDAGEVASAAVVEALHSLPIVYGLDELVTRAVDATRKVNQDLINLARSNGSPRTIGTTLVALAVSDQEFRCFWAGDSRAYRYRDGELRRISRDHSLVQDLIDAGMLEPEEAEGHANANIVTRAVGASDDLKVDVIDGDARAGDIFVLASDGLTRVVGDEEIAAELAHDDLDVAADRLLEMVLDRGAPDNVSMVITRLIESDDR